MNVLFVDDELLIRDVVKEYLEVYNYQVYEASDGFEAIEEVKNNDIDLIIMDIMMPKMDGYTAVKEIKKIRNIPVIMLSARADEYDKLLGFELGIDDYVTKPFSPKELVARVKAVLKRSDDKEINFQFGQLVLMDNAHQVFIGEKEIVLTPKEYDLLKYLIQNHNIALTREQLLTKIWGYDFFGDDRTIDTHIKTLRKHLGTYGKYIKTIRKVGYKFEYQE